MYSEQWLNVRPLSQEFVVILMSRLWQSQHKTLQYVRNFAFAYSQNYFCKALIVGWMRVKDRAFSSACYRSMFNANLPASKSGFFSARMTVV